MAVVSEAIGSFSSCRALKAISSRSFTLVCARWREGMRRQLSYGPCCNSPSYNTRKTTSSLNLKSYYRSNANFFRHRSVIKQSTIRAQAVARCWLSSNSSTSTEEEEGLTWVDIGTEELLEMLERRDIQLIDVRELHELEESGRIPQSLHIPCETPELCTLITTF